MTPKTLTALRESIKHWEENVAALKKHEGEEFLGAGKTFLFNDGTQVAFNQDACALCKIFADNDCQGCPVMERTGEDSCVGSPWARLFKLYLDCSVITPNIISAAQAELDFLKSLLPEGE